jgi:hypothetical protein
MEVVELNKHKAYRTHTYKAGPSLFTIMLQQGYIKAITVVVCCVVASMTLWFGYSAVANTSDVFLLSKSVQNGETAHGSGTSSEVLASEDVVSKEPVTQTQTTSTDQTQTYNGAVLTRSAGTIIGPSGKETYYNLDMSGVVQIMRNMGNTDEYWVRDDGVKMLGDYVMIAADLNLRPRGSLVETSLGTGIVCDTGTFALTNPTQIDIAVTW